MIMDQNLRFSTAQAITASALSTYTYDILAGTSVLTSGGTYPISPNIIGNTSFFGEDLGVGRGVGEPVFVFNSGAGTPAAATSLTILIQGAPDNGGGTIAGLTFVPYVSSGPIPLASILGSSRLWSTAWPRRLAGAAMPRFINISYVVAGSNFTGLSLSADVTLGPDDGISTLQHYPANF